MNQLDDGSYQQTYPRERLGKFIILHPTVLWLEDPVTITKKSQGDCRDCTALRLGLMWVGGEGRAGGWKMEVMACASQEIPVESRILVLQARIRRYFPDFYYGSYIVPRSYRHRSFSSNAVYPLL